MEDRELLEAAAKAAGIIAEWHNDDDADFDAVHEGMFLKGERGPDNSKYWNPLTDDGDALRLAVKLWIETKFNGKASEQCGYISARFPHPRGWLATEQTFVVQSYVPEEMLSNASDRKFAEYLLETEPEKYVRGVDAATRRAIVRAAAALANAQDA